MAVQGTEPISAANLQAIFNTDGGSSPIVDAIYPVGSIYMSVNSTNPQTLFGGTWQRIQGRFLFAADSAHAAGSTGGEETHKLTVEEMPTHGHNLKYCAYGSYQGTYKYLAGPEDINGELKGYNEWRSNWGDSTATESVQKSGGDQPHNNMPPYLSVYMWKRTA